jgi:hypothetical protein
MTVTLGGFVVFGFLMMGVLVYLIYIKEIKHKL